MIYFSNMIRAEWLPNDCKYVIQGSEVFPHSGIASEALECAKELQYVHSLVYGQDDFIAWLFGSLELSVPYSPSSHPFGFKLNIGDVLFIATWKGHRLNTTMPMDEQTNSKSVKFVQWQRLEIQQGN
jgi:hypothetical protein